MINLRRYTWLTRSERNRYPLGLRLSHAKGTWLGLWDSLRSAWDSLSTWKRVHLRPVVVRRHPFPYKWWEFRYHQSTRAAIHPLVLWKKARRLLLETGLINLLMPELDSHTSSTRSRVKSRRSLKIRRHTDYPQPRNLLSFSLYEKDGATLGFGSTKQDPSI